MSDREKIKAEVERLIKEYSSIKVNDDYSATFKKARVMGYRDVLHFINSISTES